MYPLFVNLFHVSVHVSPCHTKTCLCLLCICSLSYIIKLHMDSILTHLSELRCRLNNSTIWGLLIISKVVIKLRYRLRDPKYGHAEYGINIYFISTNKQPIC